MPPVNVMVMLRKAVRELETEKSRLDRQLAALRVVLGTMNTSTGRAIRRPRRAGSRKRRRLSAAAGRAVSRRMKMYWAKRKAAAAKGTAKRSRG